MSTPFSASNIHFQDRYKITGLTNGVDGGDSVAMRQLLPVVADVQNLINQMGDVVMESDFANRFAAAVTSADLQNSTQVSAAIAAALSGLPEPESRLISVAVATVFQGTLADAANAQFPDVTPSDSLDIDDAASSCILIDSPTTGETGIYQKRTNGVLSSLNAALFAQQLGFYSRFYVIASGSRPGREFAIVALDATAGTLEIEEIPYTDEYVGLGPISVSNQNKTINLRFSANDFVLVGSENEFTLHPALRAAINLIPGLQQQFTDLEGDVEALSETLTEQVSLLTGQIQSLQQTQQLQAQNISSLQASMGDLLARLATLEVTALRKSHVAGPMDVYFQSGSPMLKNAQGMWEAAPPAIVQQIGGTADNGIYLITHNRGLTSFPDYWECNASGSPVARCVAYQIVAFTENTLSVQVETYKNVMLMFASGIKAAALV